jgi:galactonate dehydratase
MRITEAETASFDRHGRQVRLLVLRTDTERVGVGELIAHDPTRSGGQEEGLIRMLLGRDPYETEALLVEVLERAPSASVELGFLAAAHTAMSDLVGRELGVPVHQLMGGRVRDQVRACATDWVAGIQDLSELAAAARRVTAAGFTALRIDPFTGVPEPSEAHLTAAIDAVRTIREAVPDETDLVVNAAGLLTGEHALKIASAIRSFEPLWLEDPLLTDALEPLRIFGQRPMLPLAGGRRSNRHGLIALAMSGLVDHLVVDLSRVGGLGEARRIAAIAEISHVDIVLATSGGTVAIAAALQLAATIPNLSMVEVSLGAILVEAGMIEVDLGPGLGLRPMGILDGEVAS